MVRPEGGHLLIRPAWAPEEIVYEPVAENQFVGKDNVVEFQIAIDETVLALRLGGDWTLPKIVG